MPTLDPTPAPTVAPTALTMAPSPFPTVAPVTALQVISLTVSVSIDGCSYDSFIANPGPYIKTFQQAIVESINSPVITVDDITNVTPGYNLATSSPSAAAASATSLTVSCLISKAGVKGITNDGLLTILKQSIQNGAFTFSLNANAEVNNINNNLKCLIDSSAQKVEPVVVASNASADDKKTSKLSVGALAGIIIAALIVAGFIAGGIYLYTSAKVHIFFYP